MSLSITQLPELNSEYPVSAGQAASYQRDGHILLRHVASSEEVEAYHSVIGTTTGRFNTEKRSLHERDTYGKAFLQVTNLWRKDEAVARFVMARRFAKIAAELMGVPAVRLYHDQALYKEPGGGPTPWHQDQFYWPLDTDKTITMWMPLVDVSIEMGALTFASGSHKHGSVCSAEISDRSEHLINELVKEQKYLVCVEDMKAGDATFHSGWTLHKAPGNNTEGLREIMTIIYFADGARCTEPNSQYQQADLDTWMPGCKPGDLAACDLNPVLYDR